jgi:conjugative relaxase-like TrwC/TraI family protein
VLSVQAMANGREGYYLDLARADYYAAGGEPPGRWMGRGARALGLEGRVRPADLRAALAGFGPGGRPLVRNAGSPGRQPGWDLTFSAPKSVSLFWAMAGPEARRAVQRAQADAVRAGLDFLEDAAAWSRVGAGGRGAVRCGLVAAAFEHGTSRATDPNLHTHVLLINVGVSEAVVSRTILSRPVYEAKMAAGAVYRAELAYQLRERLGLSCEARRTWFELAGVPDEALAAFSTRRRDIAAALAARGASGPKAAAVAALATRPTKPAAPRADLFPEWQAAGSATGFGPAEAERLTARVAPHPDPAARLAGAIPAAAADRADRRGSFAEPELVRAVAEAVQAEGVPAAAIRDSVRAYLGGSPDVVRLGTHDRRGRYTTADLFAVERALLQTAHEMTRTACVPADEADLFAALNSRDLHPEQVAALRHLTQAPGRLRLGDGRAGTGKTALLTAAREVWERGGRAVGGVALAGKAARGLEAGSGIPSETLHRRLAELDAGRLALTADTVVVADEAGMIPTRLLARLIDHARRANALLVLVGDHRQLQSIDAGGGFKALGDRLGRAELTRVVRQREAWARRAVLDLAAGDAASALRSFADHGLVTVAADRGSAAAALAADWAARGGAADPDRHLILAATNDEAAALNRLCRVERARAGAVTGPPVRLDGSEVAAGDRVLFTRNSRLLGVTNGSLGTVVRADPGRRRLAVRLDGGPVVSVPVADYPHLRPGYAVTTHRAQGATAAHAYVLAGGAMTDRELTYVQLSRARGTTRVYVDRLSAGESLGDLARAMTRSRQHRLAHDVRAAAPREVAR